MTAVTIDELMARITEALLRDRVLIVGIDGFGGAGKSTLARRIVDHLGCGDVITMDDFIVKERMNDDTWERGWDRDRVRAEVLDPVAQGQPAHYRRLVWDSNTLDSPITLRADRLLIVEGITALHPDLRGAYALSVWVDAPIEIARERGAARDAGNENEGMWEKWSANDLRYLAMHRPDLAATFTLAT